ncbi:hypothetical protein LEP1GSC018_0026 [Leptospira kirschneri str. 2008720114]|nr:hypothetical protein LEP1GSC018_0026 [Leptospira kirschneri str. 2008720114]
MEEFYQLSEPKKTTSKELKEGYFHFWSEWRERTERARRKVRYHA